MVPKFSVATAVIVSFLIVAARFVPIARAQKPAASFVIRNVRVFDGEKVIARTSVVVTDGKIASMGPNPHVAADARIIDGSGKTLLPGLIDAHVHIWNRDVLTSALAFGVTTELDMFMRRHDAKIWKEQESRGAYDIADFRTAGTCITSPAGHGTEYGFPISTISDPSQAQAFVDERIAQGSDYIKIMYDQGANYTVMSRATMAAVIAAAHKRGKLVLVHIGSYEGAIEALQAGADGLAHLPFDRPPGSDFGALVKAHHAFVITTMAIPKFLFGSGKGGASVINDPLLSSYLLTQDIGFLKSIAPVRLEVREMILHRLETLKNPSRFQIRERESLRGIAPDQYDSFSNAEVTLRMLRDAGVPILAGTDAANGVSAGTLMHAELETIVKAGLTPSAALADATSVPAKIFSLPDRGRIAPGLRADLLLVRGDPTTDISATKDIVAIWKQGVLFDRDAFRDSVAQRNEACRFGAGWFPWVDAAYGGTSKVRVKVVDGGPNQASATMIVRGEVKSTIAEPFAGAMFFPIGWGFSPVDYSGVKNLTFWSRGDGKQYWISIFTKGGGTRPAPVRFAAGSEWQSHTIALSKFGTDGHDLTGVFFGGDQQGDYQFELSGFRFGTGAKIGANLVTISAIPGSHGEFSAPRLVAVNVKKGSPADAADLKPGDTIVSIGNERVTESVRAEALIWQASPGSSIPIEIMRGAHEQIIHVIPRDKP